eukprot:6636945-Prorocentrum_lima.AAC.1
MTSSLVGSEMCIRDSRGKNQLLDDSKKKCEEIGVLATARFSQAAESVSYTHLTLPTICSV